MKTAGIIGGLGPETTSDFFLEVISSCFEFNKVHRPPMLIFNVPMIFDLEKRIINGGDTEGFLELLVDSAKKLEKGGADFIVIPCNSAHIFIKEIRKSVNIPVLSIVEESVKFLADRNINRVGLLATTQTIESKLFDNECKNNGIKITKPNPKNQLQISSIITRVVKNNHSLKDQNRLLRIINDFEDTDCVLLACTDLQLLISSHKKVKVFDTMEILAQATAKEILNEN